MSCRSPLLAHRRILIRIIELTWGLVVFWLMLLPRHGAFQQPCFKNVGEAVGEEVEDHERHSETSHPPCGLSSSSPGKALKLG
jgi:hypothetical protein